MKPLETFGKFAFGVSPEINALRPTLNRAERRRHLDRGHGCRNYFPHLVSREQAALNPSGTLNGFHPGTFIPRSITARPSGLSEVAKGFSAGARITAPVMAFKALTAAGQRCSIDWSRTGKTHARVPHRVQETQVLAVLCYYPHLSSQESSTASAQV